MAANKSCNGLEPGLMLAVEPDVIKLSFGLLSGSKKVNDKKLKSSSEKEQAQLVNAIIERRGQLVSQAKEELKTAKNKFMPRIAKYTHKNRDVRSMSAQDALDYATFIINQQDVHATEKARDNVKTIKNFKKIKSFSEFMKWLAAALIMFALLSVLCLVIAAIVYLLVYFKKDKLKRVVNFMMLGTALAFVGILAVYLLLFLKMAATIKKIMLLM